MFIQKLILAFYSRFPAMVVGYLLTGILDLDPTEFIYYF